VQVFLTKFVSKEAQNLNIVAAILNSTQQQGQIFVTSFHPRDFVQLGTDKPFNLPRWVIAALEPYYFEPNMLQSPK